MLNTIVHGQPTAQPPLIIAHGLFGSARNWSVIARRLSAARQVVAVDMRNHGASPWNDSQTYADMAGDLAEVTRALGGHADVLGHSMGGKAAMLLALTHPGLVRRLVVADIAPVAYGHSHIDKIEAMQRVDATTVTSRADAARAMALPDPALAAFLLQSLDLAEHGWHLNLPALARNMPEIMGFPATTARFAGPVLLLTGAASDYVRPAHHPLVRTLFPQVSFIALPDAGHWLHADQPRAFEAAVAAFLDQVWIST